jgi:7,8-dihydropterin-6-yl-methyl-4-(beta-D-ribofuranosyl)aminobenzene 5'-phosphate synthase
VLLSGCSHRGALNIASQFEPDVMIGGFHVSKMPLGDSLAKLALSLAKKNTHYYTAHCTGCEQYEFMKKYLPRLDYLACGDTIDI